MNEPTWILDRSVRAIHLSQLAEHGGPVGIRDEGLLESALNRPKQRWTYEQDTDIAQLAASYAFGICQNPFFFDGNKRTATVLMETFIILNGSNLHASDSELYQTMMRVASGQLAEASLADWIRNNL